jgi:hypothetical protein
VPWSAQDEEAERLSAFLGRPLEPAVEISG